MAYLELRDVTKRFTKTLAVSQLNLSVEKGEFISLLGPSGCGKSTTLRMIAGLESPDVGRIIFNGTDITDVPPNKRGAGMVFQAYALFPNLTVRGNIAFGLEIAGKTKAAIEESVSRMLQLVQLEGVESRYPSQLSGGQQQRVALARALAPEPHILLLDEPLSALDAMVRVDLRAEIRHIQSELGITTVYVTHDQEEALSISDRVAVMRLGTIEQIGTPEDIYRNPSSRFLAAFIGTANQFSGRAVDNFTVQGEHYTFETDVPAELIGKSVVVLVRPENIKVFNKAEHIPDGFNLINGEVQTITFMGSVTRLTLSAFGERVVCDVPANTHHFEHNQRVVLAVSPDLCQVMAE
ncbi:MAG: ABC transporter ATP-binding protein [Anaerolineales bacterium]|jgi:putative spermidine/putrescine transport system ATP-binding protein